MTRVIDGVRYETQFSKHLGFVARGLGPFDPKRFAENLFRKQDGEYFLAGEGGPDSHWGRIEYNCKTSGYGIEPLSEKEARAWVRKYLNEYKYNMIFGPDKKL